MSPAAARASAARRSAGSSRAMPRSRTSAPAARACQASISPLALTTCPRCGHAPTGTNSSPVQRIATRGARCTCTTECPQPASRASSPGPSSAPGSSRVAPAATSDPATRTKWPGPNAPTRSRSTSSCSPCTAQSSCAMTASAPGGSTAPVEIRSASFSPSASPCGCPAALSPRRRRYTRGPSPASKSVLRIAQPSIVATSAPGRSQRARGASASTRPWAAVTSTATAGSGQARASASSCAAAMSSSAAITASLRPACRPCPSTCSGAFQACRRVCRRVCRACSACASSPAGRAAWCWSRWRLRPRGRRA